MSETMREAVAKVLYDEIRKHPDPLGCAEESPPRVPARKEKEEMDWKPIQTAPIGKMVLLWNRGWRHPFPGQRNGDLGRVYIDTCEIEAKGRDDFATHWADMPEPPEEDRDFWGRLPTYERSSQQGLGISSGYSTEPSNAFAPPRPGAIIGDLSKPVVDLSKIFRVPR
jgi:hypothetical protein